MSHKDMQKAEQEQNEQLVTMQSGLIVAGEWFKKQGIWKNRRNQHLKQAIQEKRIILLFP